MAAWDKADNHRATRQGHQKRPQRLQVMHCDIHFSAVAQEGRVPVEGSLGVLPAKGCLQHLTKPKAPVMLNALSISAGSPQ